MSVLYLFSSDVERDAAFPDGVPVGVVTGITGVGPVESAIGTARAIAASRPDAIVFVGTCGAHRESALRVGDVVLARTVRLSSGDVARGHMRIAAPTPVEATCDAELSGRIVRSAQFDDATRVTEGIVACTIGITESDELASLLRAHDHSDAENLEAFAVVRAAGAVPTAVVLAVTNIIGEHGGRDWRANYQESMRRLARGIITDVSDAAYGIG